MECPYSERSRRQVGRRGVDEDTDQNVDHDDNALCAKEGLKVIHLTSSLRTLELLRDLALGKD
jgi:hypothetical protein